MSNNLVINMVIRKTYIVNNKPKVLTSKEIKGYGGSGFQEPYYKLVFDEEEDKAYIKNWDDSYKEG